MIYAALALVAGLYLLVRLIRIEWRRNTDIINKPVYSGGWDPSFQYELQYLPIYIKPCGCVLRYGAIDETCKEHSV